MESDKLYVKSNRWRLLSGFIILLFLYCAKDYNPFNDVNNSRTHILKSDRVNDTLLLFTTDSVVLFFTVCNLIDKIIVEADNNRHFDDTVFTNVCFPEGKLSLPVSFYDTGFQEVRIVTHLIDGDSLISKRSYYVLSEFKQNDILGNYGDSLELRAEPYNPDQDRDVHHVWKIGNTVVESEKSTAFISIDEPLLDDKCTLRICDLQKQYCSPPVFFRTVLSDTVKPEIIIQNPVSNDTIYVPGDTLQLKVKIKKSFGTTTVYADGAMMTRAGSNSFVHIISSGNKQNTLIDIVAVAGSGNRSNREVCVVFNSSVLQYVKPVIQLIGHPGDEAINVQQKKYNLSGRVVFNANNVMKYSVMLFNVTQSVDQPVDSISYSGKETFTWNFVLNLEKESTGEVFYRAELRDSLSNVIDKKTVNIQYCANCIDSVPPVIASVLVNNDTLSSSYRYVSNSRSVSIELICFDLGSGVESVLIGNKVMLPDEKLGYRWIKKIDISHVLTPDTLVFCAVDTNGNRSNNMRVVAGYNSAPVIKVFPDSICHAFTGIPYTDTVVIVDGDPHDHVTYSITSANRPGKNLEKMSIDQYGRINWTPDSSDLEFNTVTVSGKDRYGASVSVTYRIYVSGKALEPVSFLTSGNDFPKTLSCMDSLTVPLRVHGGTGPVTIVIIESSTDGEIKINNSDKVFRWKPPLVEQAASYQFFIVAKDILGIADTLWPVVTILPENRAFEIVERKWTGKKWSDGFLDLNGMYPDTLFYTIEDPDSALFEKYTIVFESGIEKYSIITDSSSFFIVLDPQRKRSGVDMVQLTISDNGGHVKKIKKNVYYGSPPAVTLKIPHYGTVVDSKNVLLSWVGTDPDSDGLSYDVSLLFNDGTIVEKRAGITDTFVTVSTLKKEGVYYWNVTAHDNKSSTESSTGRFSYIPPDKVRWDTLHSRLPSLIRCGETASAPLTVKNGYPPFNIIVLQSVEKNNPQIRNDSIVWTPDCFQVGRHLIILEVTDSIGNKDVFSFHTSVYGSDSLSISLKNTVPRKPGGEIDLSDVLVKEVMCTLLINDPDPSPPDSFTIEVLLGNVRQEFFSRSADRLIALSLKSDPDKKRDFLSVKVTEMKGISSTYVDSIYYGE